MNKDYPGEILSNARTTAGGSMLLEFDDKPTADRVKQNWRKTTFGGNAGVVTIKENPPAGIIKNVFVEDEEKTDDDIINEVKRKYPDSEVDLFQKDDEFSGIIKIIFNNDAELETALERQNIIQ